MTAHIYTVELRWKGNLGSGTSDYKSYSRSFELRGESKQSAIAGSSDQAFRGDPERWNPEELLLGAIAACHKLWYLHLCSDAKIAVTDYADRASAVMGEDENGVTRILSATLNPQVVISGVAEKARALALHAEASRACFIANSVNFPIEHEAEVTAGTI